MVIKDSLKEWLLILREDAYVKMLLLLIIIAFIIRIWGIWNIEQTDEFNEVFEALKVDSGRLNLERWNKKVLIYILALEYGIYFFAGWVAGIFSSISDFASKIVINMSPLFIIGRATSASFGTLIVLFTYLIGSKLFNKQTGLIAALFLSFNYVHVEHSHLVLVDITMTLMVMCCFYFTTLLMYRGEKTAYFFSGLFAGLAIVAKTPSVFILISIGVAHLLHSRERSASFKNILISKHILFMLFGFSLGTILGSPGILVGLPKFLKWLTSLFGAYIGTHDQIDYWAPINGYKFYIVSICKNMGLPLFIITMSGVLYFLIKPRKEFVLLISFALPFYLFMAHSKWVLTDRYMIPIYPFLSIIAGYFFFEITKLLRINKKLIATIALLILLAIPIKNVVLFEMTLLQRNTRYWSKDWIEGNIPQGSKILIDSGRTINTYSPPLFNSKENIISMITTIESLEAGETFDDSRIVDSKSSIYFKYLLNNPPEITYNLTSTELGRKAKSIEYYRNNDFDYIITSTHITAKAYNKKWAGKYPIAAKFYRSLDKEFTIVKEFTPGLTRSGPTITIYKVK